MAGWLALALSALSVTAAGAACLDLRDPQNGEARRYFMTPDGLPMAALPAPAAYQQLIAEACAAAGLPEGTCLWPVLISETGFGALAVDCPLSGQAVLCESRLCGAVPDMRARLAVFHELGHLVCGHLGFASDADQRRAQELEADRFAGAVLARLGYAKAHIEALLSRVAPGRSALHPARAERRVAFNEGYDRPGGPLCAKEEAAR